MALYYTKVVDGVTVKVEERTFAIHIMTPKTPQGPKNYSVVAYRERIETIEGVVTASAQMPPLTIPLTPDLQAVMSLISGTIDTKAAQSIEAGKWPLDRDGNLIPV